MKSPKWVKFMIKCILAASVGTGERMKLSSTKHQISKVTTLSAEAKEIN